MPFEVSGFGNSSNGGFDSKFTKKFDKLTDFGSKKPKPFVPRAFNFEPADAESDSETKFYNRDALWNRWRRGYDLYSITQTYLGSNSKERNTRGDFRMYCSFQQFPGVFIPARIFTFPSSSTEIDEQVVAIRDTDSFNCYEFGLPIEQVRYLGPIVEGTYSQSGTTLTITKSEHGFLINENISLVVETGSAVSETVTISAVTQNTITCTASTSLSTSGNLDFRLSTPFSDLRWTQMRVKVRFIPPTGNFLKDERMTDRVIERDPGLDATYSQSTTTITVTCAQDHGLNTGNKVFLEVSTGSAVTNLYDVTVINATRFTVTSLTSATTSGNAKVFRRIRGFDYNDYVGYTCTGIDAQNEEILFQRADSYATKIVNDRPTTITPAHRGFTVGRFLSTEIRYQCSCSDYLRRERFNLYKEATRRQFPSTTITNVKPGQRQERDGNVVNTRDDVGVYSDFGYVAVNNFYNLPTYEDSTEFSYPNLLYYQARWCKHIYAAMWSVVHDEGNNPIDITASYTQNGPVITVSAVNHGLTVNTRVRFEITSGNVLDGEYTVSSVPDANTFTVIYPFSQTAILGYCVVRSLKKHEYVGAWLREPSDQPLGIALERFYDNLEKENSRVRESAERLSTYGYGLPWSGAKEVIGNRNQPEIVGNFNDNIVSMLVTDSIRRDQGDNVNRDGVTKNSTTNLLLMMQKVFNIDVDLVQDTKMGMLDQPLTEYTAEFQFGEVEGGRYISGELVDEGTQSTLDCKTYNPVVEQVIFVDSGLYINN